MNQRQLFFTSPVPTDSQKLTFGGIYQQYSTQHRLHSACEALGCHTIMHDRMVLPLSIVHRMLQRLVGPIALLARQDSTRDPDLRVLRHENTVLRAQLPPRALRTSRPCRLVPANPPPVRPARIVDQSPRRHSPRVPTRLTHGRDSRQAPVSQSALIPG
jgi:hypothetical protein